MDERWLIDDCRTGTARFNDERKAPDMTSTCAKWIVYACLTLFAGTGAAQSYPAKTLRLVVPFAPGGTNDIMARGIAPELGAILGQQRVVDNRPGANGQIGAEIVARSPPDGYTLMLVSSSVMSHVPAVYSKLRYDIINDFAPVGRVS